MTIDKTEHDVIIIALSNERDELRAALAEAITERDALREAIAEWATECTALRIKVLNAQAALK